MLFVENLVLHGNMELPLNLAIASMHERFFLLAIAHSKILFFLAIVIIFQIHQGAVQGEGGDGDMVADWQP